MSESVKFYCESLSSTDKLAEKFADAIRESGAFVCLYGDIGAGKTAFTKLVCKYLDVKQKVTSPSFVILNEYKSGVIPVYHFDLYRLEKEGISTVSSELEEYSEGKILTMVEWAEFSPETELPFDRLVIKIEYSEENSRIFTFTSLGSKSAEIIKRMV